MKIEWMRLRGFRNFEDEVINLANQTLIIGANDVGKTNMIYALRILFDRSLSDKDLELLDSDYNVYSKSDSIEITVKVTDVTEDCLLSTFKGDVQNGTVYIQYNNTKSGEYSISSGHSEETLDKKMSRFYIKRLHMEYVNTNRNLSTFMKRERKQFLENAKASLIDDQKENDEKAIKELKKDLANLNEKVDDLNYIKSSLESVNTELQELAIHNEEQTLLFKNANSDIISLLDNLELTYATEDETLTLGGDGRNNQIFLATWVAKQKSKKTLEKVTFFAIEEPEAHLHPHQQRKLSNYLLENFEEQIFITTHSPHIASEFRPDRIVKLYTRNKITKVARGGCNKISKLEFDDFGYRLDAITADVFFVNAVFLVEGPSEKLFYTALAKNMNIDLDRLNVSIISVNGVGFKPYIKICLALEIPFVFRTDNDIFNKSIKISDTEQIELSYHAGVSRIMGIYEELLDTVDNKSLIEYWNKNKEYNEWNKGEEIPAKATQILNYISKDAEKENIFLAYIDLENDLVESELFDSLKSFYKTKTKKSTVKKMQNAKAENMLSFLSDRYETLGCLKDDKIAAPLKLIQRLSEKMVRNNG
ncbi:AAA family ATPase [Virgibacillus halodenitrificans]|uniref:ATP-dependent nuclease n=1 Tax=Virgibacillus halodenitrificans TaxID=1482 RepID=UPI001FB3C925|nr:AAA family ATPase [Virgibacillus halodenitrificans]MCJ0931911.1 AAA family ATPase [Virgibacillus halodenitrificans]